MATADMDRLVVTDKERLAVRDIPRMLLDSDTSLEGDFVVEDDDVFVGLLLRLVTLSVRS